MGHGVGAFPGAGVILTADPPALTRQAIGGAHDEDGEFGLPGGGGAAVHFIQGFAECAHAGPAEGVAQCGEGFGIGERLAGAGAGLHQGFHHVDVGYVMGHGMTLGEAGGRIKRG